MSDLVFSPQARQDLIEIWDFIAQDDIDAADRVCDDIEKSVRPLPKLLGWPCA